MTGFQDLPACSSDAEQAYHIPHEELRNVSGSGKENGIGVMRIDPGWLPWLEHAGFDPVRIATDECTSIAAAAWILAWKHLNDRKHPPVRTADAHAGRNYPASPPQYGKELSECIATAARENGIRPDLFKAVLKTEGGKPGQAVRNRNGTEDLGIAQINASWLPRLKEKGITRQRLLDDDCLNIHVGAWILGQEMSGKTPARPAEFWQSVGNYNSHTPAYNIRYQARVWKNLQK